MMAAFLLYGLPSVGAGLWVPHQPYSDPDAPTLRRNMSPLARATKTARSMSAFMFAKISAKYFGEVRTIPSVPGIFSMLSFTISPVIAYCLSSLPKHPRRLGALSGLAVSILYGGVGVSVLS